MNRYNTNYFLILLTFLICISCKKLDKNTEKKQVEINIDPIAISIDSLSKYKYDVFTFKGDNEIELITYNSTNHSIEFFNLNSKKLSKRLFLEADGPKAIGNVQGLYYHNQDSIFVYSRGKINIIKETYSKESNPNLFTFIENYDLNFEPQVNYHFRLYYIPEIKSIPLFNIYFDQEDKTSPIAEQISLFNLKDFKIKRLPYYQTEPSKTEIEYGFLNYSTLSQPFKGQFFVNQVYSPKTLKFNYQTRNFKKVISSEQTYHKKNLNPENWEPHAIESNFYNQLETLNDSTFVRFVWNELNYEPKENGFLQKELTLEVFDKNYNLVREFKLAKNTYHIYSWFIANNNIYIQVGHPLYEHTSENELIIHEIQISRK